MQTQSNSKYIIGLIAIVIIIAVVINAGDKEVSEVKNNNNAPAVTENNLDTTNSVVDDEKNSEVENEIKEVAVVEKTVGQYLNYDAKAVANSEAENIILFFSATWCSSCRALDANINKNLGSIPANTEIYKLDFDTHTDLKKKYGVAMQHTLVMIDKEGDMIKKWSGGTTLDHLLGNLN